VASLDVNPPTFATAKGRSTIAEHALPSVNGNWPVMKKDEGVTRLPAELKWNGRL
jgi:hypothetical protein